VQDADKCTQESQQRSRESTRSIIDYRKLAWIQEDGWRIRVGGCQHDIVPMVRAGGRRNIRHAIINTNGKRHRQ
jgi:hypothetical protein